MDKPEDGRGVTAVTTHDLEQAHDYIDKVFTSHRLVLREAAALNFDLRYATSARLMR